MTNEERYDLALENEAKSAEAALVWLGKHVARLCKVRFAGSYLLANKAERFYAELPPGDCDDFRDFLLGEVKLYAEQFEQVGNIAKRAEVTEALQELIDDTR